MNIDVFTFVTGSVSDYAEYLKYTCDINLSGKHKINWKCIQSLDVTSIPNGYQCVGKSGGQEEHNSMKHALAMHEALKHIESEYVLFVDVDVAVLYKGWDDVIVQNLNNFDCFGGAHAKSKSRYCRTRYKKFPKVNFFSFRKDVLKKVQLDFKPFNEEDFFGEVTKENSEFLNMEVGAKIAYDVGWKLPIIFKENGLTYNYMPCFPMDSQNSKLPYLNKEHKKFCYKKTFTMEEWHYNKDLFATHQKHARHHSLNDPFGIAWKTRVDLYLNRGEWYEKEKIAL